MECSARHIRLHLTTYGGSVHAAFAVVDAIRMLKVPVDTVVVGHVASAGTLISVAGARRFMYPHATALLHEVRSGMVGKYSELKDEYLNTSTCMDRMINFYSSRTKLNREQLPDLLRRDLEWSPQQCLDFGVIDEILETK